MSRFVPFLLLCLMLVASRGVWAVGDTNILYTFNGDSADDGLGWSVSGAGDVNGDGYADQVMGAPYDDNNGSNAGSARVFSGANGSTLYAFNGDSANDYFGSSVSGAGDVNGDGYVDVIVGASGDDNNGASSGSTRVLSGANGSTLYAFNGDSANDYFGTSVSGTGDVNGDGYADVIVGAPGDDNNGTGSGSARVFSGADGSVLYAFDGDSAGDYFGQSVSGAGDVNGDGYADVIVGAPGDDNNGTGSGSARVFSGADGSVLYTFDGDSAYDEFGDSVGGAGDANSDGYTDVIVGAHYDDNNGSNSGMARLFSGVDGSVLYTFDGDSAYDEFGYSVSGAGDVNADGYADVVVGARYDDNNGTDSGSARVFSGADGSVLYAFDGDSAYDEFGDSVSSAGDVNADGYADVVVGAIRDDNNGSNSGMARLFSGKGLWTDTDGDGQTDVVDPDDDNDGVADGVDIFPLDATESIDADGDGTGNNADTDDDNDNVDDTIDNCPLVSNANQIDTDGDAQGDACDADDDNDGVLDSSDKFRLNPAASSDNDNDGSPDSWNVSCDTVCQLGSGLMLDNCLTISNPTQANADGDTEGDACDINDDNDTLIDTTDNCPLVSNDNQLDWDGDGVGNACDSALAVVHAATVSAGGSHTCAITTTNTAMCWGSNSSGQLGDGTTTSRNTPVTVTSLAGGVSAIAVGEFHTCALTMTGGVKCWGDNLYGRLGDGTTTTRYTPVDVVGLTSGVIAIAVDNDHSCAVTNTGGVKCWGYNYYGQLGDGTKTNRKTPVDVTGLTTGASDISLGDQHTCALMAGGSVKCWGVNASGRLGDGTTLSTLTPVDVINLTGGVSVITAGGEHTCARLTGGSARCWGNNTYGQLGDGSSGFFWSRPTPVINLAGGINAISVGDLHSCAITATGGVTCWGNNGDGRLGDNTGINRDRPTNVAGLTSGVAAVAAGARHSCAVNVAGGVKCWGNNQHGHLGNGMYTNSLTPVYVVGFMGDADGDEIADPYDNCPSISNLSQVDTDGDGVGDICDPDTDTDGDGVYDINDAFPLDAAESVDTDGDGIGNNADTDDDGDGVDDGSDNCALVINAAQTDTDSDGFGDDCDTDDDNDGVPDTSDAFSLDASEFLDTDRDGVGNNADTDDDGDGVLDPVDPAPTDIAITGYQSPWLYIFSGDSANDHLGGSVSDAGDVNADGYADVIVGADNDDNNGTDSGMSRVLSGKDASILYTFNGDSAYDYFGVSVSGTGDVNGDGYADLIVGATGDDNNGNNFGSARVFSGKDGAIVYTFNGNSMDSGFGNAVSNAGDINNDGYADVIVGAPVDDSNGTDAGLAKVFSGKDGAILYSFSGDNAGDKFGGAVSDVGDVNKDGYADVIVGAFQDDNNGDSSGSARVFSGKDGSILYTFNGSDIGDLFGRSVSGAGDVNDDGYVDVIVGATGDDNNGSSTGSAQVFSGKDGSTLYLFNGNTVDGSFGHSVSGAGDVNGDGYADVVVGADRDSLSGIWFGGGGSARVFSGADGSVLYAFYGDSGDRLGRSVSGAGDVNGDGYMDIIVGVYGDDNHGSGSGSARIASGALFLQQTTDTDSDGLVDTLDADDDSDGTLDINDAFPQDNSEWEDSDGDYIGNNTDNCNGVMNANQSDTDGDGIGDACELVALSALAGVRAGAAVALGDFDQDGFDDLVIGLPYFDSSIVIDGTVRLLKDVGRIEIYSGADGQLLSSFSGNIPGQQLGSAIAVVADQGGDGKPDLIVGEPLFDTATLKDVGRVVLYSSIYGGVGQVIAIGGIAGDRFGSAVAVGDVNNNGTPDLMVGVPFADTALVKDVGRVIVFNGITNNILYIRSGTQTKQFFGSAIAFDDANDDLLIGSPGFDVLLPKLTDAGRVDIFDSANGVSAALFSVNGAAAGDRFGAALASFSADIGGNADVDWVVGIPGADLVDPVTLKPRKDIGKVQVFSGLNATVQVQINGEMAGDNFGAALAANGDLNNDNIPDFAIGAPGHDAPGAGTTVFKDVGTVEVFSGEAIY